MLLSTFSEVFLETSFEVTVFEGEEWVETFEVNYLYAENDCQRGNLIKLSNYKAQKAKVRYVSYNKARGMVEIIIEV